MSLLVCAVLCLSFLPVLASTNSTHDKELLQAIKERDVKLVAHFTFDGNSTTSFPDHAGGVAAQADPTRCTRLDLLGNKSAFAIQLMGNVNGSSNSSPLRIPHSSPLDASSYTLAFWANWWWGDSVLWTRKDWLDYLMLYNVGFIKYELHPGSSKIEDGPYPRECGYLDPGTWSHVALAYDSGSGELSVYTNGTLCYSSKGGKGGAKSKDSLSAGGWSGMLADVRVYSGAASADEVTSVYAAGAAIYNQTLYIHPPPAMIAANGLGWSPVPLTQADATLQGAYLNYPSNQTTTSDVDTDVGANRNGNVKTPRHSTNTSTRTSSTHVRVLWSGKSSSNVKAAGTRADPSTNVIMTSTKYHPAMQTAVEELSRSMTAAEPLAVQERWRAEGMATQAGTIIVATCDQDEDGNHLLRASLGGGQDAVDLVCKSLAKNVIRSQSNRTNSNTDSEKLNEQQQSKLHESFAIRVLSSNRLAVVGGGPAGALYGAYHVIRQAQLNRPLVDVEESPATTIRLLNHWSQFRGFGSDAWMEPRDAGANDRTTAPPGGGGGPFCDGASREDSIWSWSDLKPSYPSTSSSSTSNSNSTSTLRMQRWARLMAAAGINAIAPTDVDWFSSNDFLQHLDVLPALGSLLRAYAIKLFWTPNYLIAPLQSTADALFKAVPDFGGYLLKVGSESQGGSPTPATINAIASTLLRNSTSGSGSGSGGIGGGSSGTVLIRGFIYGSQYGKLNRESIPASFFGKYDGQYSSNVYVMGKFAALDYETAEPINALDGLLKETKYGPDFEVGKGFMMSWAGAWSRWFNADNGRGATVKASSRLTADAASGGDSGSDGGGRSANTTLLNRDCIEAVLGVTIVGTEQSWSANPLNMVNWYAFGRLAWQPSLSPAIIYDEWIAGTFGPTAGATTHTPSTPAAAAASQRVPGLRTTTGSETTIVTTAAATKSVSLAPSLGDGLRFILNASETAAANLAFYRGYRGLWYKFDGDGLRSSPVNDQALTKDGAGMPQSSVDELLGEYSPALRSVYQNHSHPRTVRALLEFGTFPLDYVLPNGRTLIDDMALLPSEGLDLVQQMRATWMAMKGQVANAVGVAYYNAELQVSRLRTALSKLHNIPPPPSPPPSPSPPPPPPSPGPVPPAASFTEHDGFYCSTVGANATRYYDKDGLSLQKCEAQCLEDAGCFCFDFEHTQKKETCRLYRGHTTLQATAHGYNAYTRNAQLSRQER